MRHTKLGTIGLDISPIAIGAIISGQPDHGFPVWSLDEETSRPLIHYALEADIQVCLCSRTMVSPPTTRTHTSGRPEQS